MTPSKRKLDRKGHFLGASQRLEWGPGEPAGAGPSPGLGVGSAEIPAGLLESDALCPESGYLSDTRCHPPYARMPRETQGGLEGLCSAGLGQNLCASPRKLPNVLPASWLAVFLCSSFAHMAHTPSQDSGAEWNMQMDKRQAVGYLCSPLFFAFFIP